MQRLRQLTFESIPTISAIYFALLQSGYDYYEIERNQEQIAWLRRFADTTEHLPYWEKVHQNTCKVYSYWPRAAILETASFFLSPDNSGFRDYDALYARIMSAGNIADHERDQCLWDWMKDFPKAIDGVLASASFQRYLEWEQEWISKQNELYAHELHKIQSCLEMCVTRYKSPVQEMQIVINPIKCVYSSDYHLIGNRFVFCSGSFRVDSVIHEFLHHVVHPVVIEQADAVLAENRKYPGVDISYYLLEERVGILNAFEEYAVRALTEDMMVEHFPENMSIYLAALLHEIPYQKI